MNHCVLIYFAQNTTHSPHVRWGLLWWQLMDTDKLWTYLQLGHRNIKQLQNMLLLDNSKNICNHVESGDQIKDEITWLWWLPFLHLLGVAMRSYSTHSFPTHHKSPRIQYIHHQHSYTARLMSRLRECQGVHESWLRTNLATPLLSQEDTLSVPNRSPS